MLELVRTLLEGNEKAATLALYTAYNRLGRPLLEAVLDVEKYPDRVPNDFGFAIEDYPELLEEEKEATTLSTVEQFRMMLDCFSLIAKVAYYDTLDCDGLPLTHALAAFPFWCKEDDLNWITVPDFGRNICLVIECIMRNTFFRVDIGDATLTPSAS